MPNIPPALVVGFNRPEKLKKSIQAALNSGIENFYVSIDGPRTNFATDQVLCEESRKVAEQFLPYVGSMKIKYYKENLGCKNGVISAINWFFQNEEFGIIIEDDVIVSKGFVDFVSAVSNSQIPNVWHINGWSLFDTGDDLRFPYFSNFPNVWGWATWSNRWSVYQPSIEQFDFDLKTSLGIDASSFNSHYKDYWNEVFMIASGIDTWDYAWVATVLREGGNIIAPPFSLTRNIGFDSTATHTTSGSQLLGKNSSQSFLQNWSSGDVLFKLGPDVLTATIVYNMNLPFRIVQSGLVGFKIKTRLKIYIILLKKSSSRYIFQSFIFFRTLLRQGIKLR